MLAVTARAGLQPWHPCHLRQCLRLWYGLRLDRPVANSKTAPIQALVPTQATVLYPVLLLQRGNRPTKLIDLHFLQKLKWQHPYQSNTTSFSSVMGLFCGRCPIMRHLLASGCDCETQRPTPITVPYPLAAHMWCANYPLPTTFTSVPVRVPVWHLFIFPRHL